MRTKIIATSFCALLLAYTAHTSAKAGFEWVPPSSATSSAPAPRMPAVPPKQVELAPLTPGDELAPLQLQSNNGPIVEKSRDGSATATITVEDGSNSPRAKGGLRSKTLGQSSTMKPQTLRMSDTAAKPAKSTAIRRTVKPREPVSLLQAGQSNTGRPPAKTATKPIKAYPAPAAVQAAGQAMPDMSGAPDVVGFGNDMPLAMALQQVVPPQYTFSFGTSVNPGVRVSWTGGRPWASVLNDMLSSQGLKARMNGNTVMVISGTGREAASMHNMNAHSPETGDENTSPEKPQNLMMLEVQRAVDETLGKNRVRNKNAQPPERSEVKITSYTVKDTTDQSVTLKRAAIQDPGRRSAPQPATRSSKDMYKRRPAGMHDFVINPHPFSTDNKATDREWEASAGDSLKDVIEQWAREANVQLVWDASYDFTLTSHVVVTGSLRKAVNVLLQSALKDQAKPDMQFIEPGNNGQVSLIVKDPNPSNRQTG